MRFTHQIVCCLFCSSLLSYATERDLAKIDIAKPPTHDEIIENGIRLKDSFAKFRTRSKVPPKPPADGQGLILEAKNVGGIELLSRGATLSIPCYRILAYFPPNEVSRSSLEVWPSVRADSAVGWFHMTGRGSREKLETTLSKFIEGIDADPADLKAWFDHRMWKTTRGFFKVYGENPQIKVSVNVSSNEGKEIAGVFLQVDWLNNLRRAEQNGTDKPATARESKREGKEKPKPESESRPQ